MAANPMHSPVARGLENPVKRTEESIAQGAYVYGIYCAVCHGPDGMTGMVNQPVGKILTENGAPPLPLASVAAYTDGQIFTKVRYGKPMMPGYPQIPPEDRWHLVNYLRSKFGGG